MDNIRERLVTCFIAVFPKLTPDQAPNISIDNFPTWDSSHHFILMQAIEETFGIQIPEEKVGEIDSYRAVEEYLAGEGR